jgi:hypothetical protein
MRIRGIRVVRFDPATTGPSMVGPIEDLVRRSWGEPGAQVEHWMEIAEWGFAAYDRNDTLVGIALTRHVREDAMWTIASVIDPGHRRSGVTFRLNIAPLWHLWTRRVKADPRSALRRVVLVNRSANPRVYRLLNDRSEVAPAVDGRRPGEDDVALLRAVCRITGGPVPDEETFVIPGASIPFPGLIPRRGELPWSGDPAVDQLFRARVGIEDEKGNLLFITSRFDAKALIWHTARISLRGLRSPQTRGGRKRS